MLIQATRCIPSGHVRVLQYRRLPQSVIFDITVFTVYQRTPDIAIDLSRKLGRGALRGQYFSVFFFRVNTLKYSVSNFHSSRLDINEWLLE